MGALYIAPLKSLINDQFYRLDELLDLSGIPVTRWHGDVAMSHKKRLLDRPAGILQITPESLEAMLINRSNDIVRLFGELRFVVIDEIHTLTGTDRGNQIICQLARIGHLIGREPRRIGLSATIGDPSLAAAWLAGGTQTPVDIPRFEEERSDGGWDWSISTFRTRARIRAQTPARGRAQIRKGNLPIRLTAWGRRPLRRLPMQWRRRRQSALPGRDLTRDTSICTTA